MINQEADQIHGGAGNGVLSRDDAVFRGERLRKEINNDGIFLFINILWNYESRKTQIPHVQRDNWILHIYIFFFQQKCKTKCSSMEQYILSTKINVRCIINKNARVLCNTRKTYWYRHSVVVGVPSGHVWCQYDSHWVR